MLHRFRLNIKRCCALAGATFLLAFALALTVSCGGSSSGTGPAARTVPPAEVGQLGSMLFYLGPASLEERVAGADVIARVRLRSVSSGAELEYNIYDDGVLRHVAVLKHRFEVLEYLKGSGGGELVAVVHELVDHETAERAAEAAAVLLAERDMRWDRREAIIFLWYGLRQRDRYLLGTVLNAEYYGDYFKDHYTIESPHEQKWLPAASTGSGEQRFLLDVPGTVPSDGSGQAASVPTITLAEMKAKIAEIEREAVAGGGSEAYRECLYHKYRWEREVRYRKGGTAGDYFYIRHDHAIGSGLPVGTRAFTDPHGGSGETAPADGSELQIMGRDARWFSVRWPGVADAARPLPAGEYKFYYTYVPGRYVICDGEPEEEKKRQEVFVQVTAPEGVLHEAFFDPVAVGNAVGADGANGVLKPASFTDSNGATSSIESISWEAGKVKVKVVPWDALRGVLDFIELDGTVSTSLNLANSSVNLGNNTFTWSVASQPWEDGDKLMVRIREAPPFANPPRLLTAAASGADAVDLSWGPVSGAAGYHVQRRESGEEAWASVDAGVTGTTRTVSGLSCETDYEFRVGAYGDGTRYDTRVGPWSGAATATTGTCTPQRPPAFSTSTYAFSVGAEAATGTSVGVVSAIDPDGGAVSYSITVGNDAGVFAIATSTGEISVAKPLLSHAATHTLTVRAVAADGDAATASVAITVASVCGNGVVVSNPDANPALVADCLVLYYGVREKLAGTATLDWGADTALASWRGVSVGGEPRRVTGLRLEDAGLDGVVPAELGGLSALTLLDLSDNSLGGEIPASLGGLSGLESLDLEYNRLSGGIPVELGVLKRLRQLSLSANRLTGPIPPVLGGLARLVTLDLAQNRLTGRVPDELSTLPAIRYLSLGSNQLTGAVPTWLGGLSTLQYLYLDDNDLTGGVPAELGGLSELRILSLGRNRLTGGIPAVLGNLSELEELSLRRNALAGEIPAALGGLSLEYLYLSGNALTGCVPLGLTDVTNNDLADLGLPDCANRAPVFATSTYAFSVPENAATSTPVGTVSAVDPDAGDAVSYSITAGNAGGEFAIGASDGAITVAGALSRKTAASHTLTVRAADGRGGAATATVVVSVTAAP